METWARAQDVPGMQVEVVRLEGRTPLIFIEVPAANGGATTTACCSTATWTSSRR
jgi:hypothetical protein